MQFRCQPMLPRSMNENVRISTTDCKFFKKNWLYVC
ncbi:unnamed protein product, partial [Larinioides sclopetarius]